MYVEAAGGSGGDMIVGSGKQRLKYKGGRPGIVWSYFKVKAGDIWWVQLSQSGTTFTASDTGKTVVKDNSTPSGGGTGSFLAGAEGGGTTYVSSTCPNSSAGPKTGSSKLGLLMAAGGGGGASRNSIGGSAGCSLPLNGTPYDVFQKTHPNPNVIGFPGGPVN